MRLDIDLHAFAPFAERIWELRGNLTSYAAWYVAIAEASGFPLATLDGKLSRVRGLRCGELDLGFGTLGGGATVAMPSSAS